ncbi:MAG: hypothetical protein ACKO7B_07975, partial [Flavobacteriales bacterium]
MTRHLWISCLVVLTLSFSLRSQDLKVMSSEEYLSIVRVNHPLAKQANTLSDAAKREIQSARGGFDPSLMSTYSDKKYDQTDYWRIWQSSLTVPVWYGFDIKAAFDQTAGTYLDPEEVTPSGGLSYL